MTQLLSRDERARLTDEQSENAEELVRQYDARAVLRQLTRAQMQHKLAEPHELEI